ARAGAVAAALDRHRAALEPSLVGKPLAPDELVLFNPRPAAWAGGPVAIRLWWPPGVVRDGLVVEARGGALPAQAEEVEVYRDGSWRSAVVVVTPTLAPFGALRLRCRSGPAGRRPEGAPERIETPAASVVLTPRRGAALRTLAFPRLAATPLA